MVFVNKTLEQMLREIGCEKPSNVSSKNIIKTEGECYILMDINPILNLYISLPDTIYSNIEFLSKKAAEKFGVSEILELAKNAIESGGGIKETRYYSSPSGLIMHFIQNKKWNYKQIINKVQEGIRYSSKKSFTGGGGLIEVRNSDIEVSYQDKSTLIMLK